MYYYAAVPSFNEPITSTNHIINFTNLLLFIIIIYYYKYILLYINYYI
jgi:hypothetical protein